MAKDTKFGTFGGVFTPSILTILGVIMYLRLPWVVGNAGLVTTLVIIAIAHVISICTGFSISSVATDKNVGVGGPYYIVSRSLGLPIGGTLGLALFTGLSFSISLYVIGFSESFLAYIGVEPTADAIRVCGTITIVALTVLTFISTALAIKTQYVILFLIAGSLVSIALGSPEVPPTGPHLQPVSDAVTPEVMFAIFFPAVTGFTAGVNMSGDLRDPKKAIPRGTLASIAVGLIVYVSLAVFLAFRVGPQQLVDDPEVLVNIAFSPELVVAGIWGATLSSALGSILGAPRILQAMSVDRITPRFFAKGHGKSNEPRNALFLAFAIGEAGILIAELDSIARIVSMVFLTTYGFLNLTTAIESWASPDFRPDFRIWKSVSLLGALFSLLVMIRLDIAAMVGATAIMALLFFALQRRQLQLDSGDTWGGIWSTLVRAGLHRLSHETGQQRNWRPNILAFRAEGNDTGPATREFATSLITGNGMLTDFVLVDPGHRAAADAARAETPVGVFTRKVPGEDLGETISSIARYHGFSGLEPNTVLLDWHAHHAHPSAASALATVNTELGFNVLAYAPGRGVASGQRARIDVWWAADRGNLPLCISLLRFITRSNVWGRATVRFLLVSDDRSTNDALRSITRRHLAAARLEAEVRIIDNTLEIRTYEDWVGEESDEADLVVCGIPSTIDAATVAALDGLSTLPGSLLLVRAGAAFPPVLPTGKAATTDAPTVAEPGTADEAVVPALRLPRTPELAHHASSLSARYGGVAESFQQQGLGRAYGLEIELLERIRTLVEKTFGQLAKGAVGANPKRRENVVNRVQSAYLQETRTLLEQFEQDQLNTQRAVLEGRIEAFFNDETLVDGGEGAQIRISRDPGDFAPTANDTPYLRRLKRTRRLGAWLRRDRPAYRVPIAPLQAYYAERLGNDVLLRNAEEFVTDSHQLAVQVGRLLNRSKTSLALIGDGPEQSIGDYLEQQRLEALSQIHTLIEHTRQRSHRRYRSLLLDSRKLVQSFANDIDRIDVARFARMERSVPKRAQPWRTSLRELPHHWFETQSLLVDRAKLGMRLSVFQHRIASITHRVKQTLLLQIRSGALSEYEALHKALLTFETEIGETAEGSARPGFKVTLDFKNRFDAKPALDNLEREASGSISELPESVDSLTEEAIHQLEEGRAGDVELASLPVRRLVHFVFETELIGKLQDAISEIPTVEQRAIGVAQDVVRLVSFNVAELEAHEDDDAELYRTQIGPVVRNGLERIAGELEALRALEPALTGAIDRQLQITLEQTDAFELGESSDRLEQHIRLHQGRKAVWGAQGFLQRTMTRVRDSLVQLLYRRSAGVVFARKLRARSSSGAIVDRMFALVSEHSPRPEVLGELPFYYRQLFFGQSAISEAFWVGREHQLTRARQVIANFRRGSQGALIVTGERGAGKTALCERIATRLLDRPTVFRVAPPPTGSIDPDTFKEAFKAAVHSRGEYSRMFSTLPARSTILIDDLELWWERSPDGLAVIETVLQLIQRYGDRALFVLGLSAQAFAFINRFRPLADNALAVLECDPLPAESLKSVVTLRHASTGLKFELGSRSEDEVSELRLARLFSRHFDYSDGNVGVSLRAWITHVDKVKADSVTIRSPDPDDWDLLDELRVDWIALLLQLVLHKHVTLDRLRRITGLDDSELRHDIDTLIRMGLVTESRQRIIEINRFVHHFVVDRLHKRGVLP